ncbi:MAG TPA: SprT-like domain-containing protein [Dissulfurispiraceae bacterium]
MRGITDTGQLSLSFGHNEKSLADYFQRFIGRPVSLVVTDNSSSILSVKTKGDVVHIRLHGMLLGAGDEVLREVAFFVRTRKGRTPLLREYINLHRDSLKSKPPRNIRANAAGRHHDLREIYDALNSEYFGGRVTAIIAWGVRSPKRTVRKRTLGSYSSHLNAIRITPVLDRRSVPRYFVEFIVYHEMLHADMGIEKRNGRNLAHSPEFKRREKRFRDYEKALAWEKTHI